MVLEIYPEIVIPKHDLMSFLIKLFVSGEELALRHFKLAPEKACGKVSTGKHTNEKNTYISALV